MTRHETQFQGDAGGPHISSDRFDAILRQSCDLGVLLDSDGVVRELSVSPDMASIGDLSHWRDASFEDCLAVEAVPKFRARAAAARKAKGAPVKPLEVNHILGAADAPKGEFPIRYSVHAADESGNLLLLGTDLRPIAEMQQQLVKAQLALEKDYERSRDYETRFRVLMETVGEAIAMVDANTGKIFTLNGAAAQLLGDTVDALTGTAFVQSFEGRQRKEFLSALEDAAGAAAGAHVQGTTRRGRKEVAITPTVFRSAGEMILLCRLRAEEQAQPVTEELRAALFALFEHGSDAMVFTDSRGEIRDANEGFLVMCDVAQLSDVRDVSLADFLARGSVDLKVLIENASRAGRMRMFATKIKGAYGTQVPVEISATHFKDGREIRFALVMRDASRLETAREGAVSDEGVRNVMELVGSAPLKDLVAATTDVVEKMCIETAVELTRNNRVAAAEMLGLSRQSLYVKLRKYGLLEKGSDS